MKKIIVTVLLSGLLSACIDLDIIPAPDPDEYLRTKDGSIVKDCSGKRMFKNSTRTDNFWKNNNLPKGVTDFVCVNGKAYLKGKEPK